MGECSCPGEPARPMLGPREGAAREPPWSCRAVGELREEEFTCVEKSARQEATEAGQECTGDVPPAAAAARPGMARTALSRGHRPVRPGQARPELPSDSSYWPN